MVETRSTTASADQARVVELLEELVVWTRFASRQPLIDALQAVLKDPRHLRAYEATDGLRGQSEVAAFAGLSQPAVSNLWARWRRQGLVVDRGKRPAHIASPSDLGIEIPEPEAPAKRPEAAQQ